MGMVSVVVEQITPILGTRMELATRKPQRNPSIPIPQGVLTKLMRVKLGIVLTDDLDQNLGMPTIHAGRTTSLTVKTIGFPWGIVLAGLGPKKIGERMMDPPNMMVNSTARDDRHQDGG